MHFEFAKEFSGNKTKNVLFLYKTTFKGMEEASILPVGEIHAEDHHKVDWKKCIICQENRFPIKKFPLSKGTSVGISKVVDCGEIRKEFNDASYKQWSSDLS